MKIKTEHVTKRALIALRGHFPDSDVNRVEWGCSNVNQSQLYFGGRGPELLTTADVGTWQRDSKELPLPSCPKCLTLVLEALIARAQRGTT